MSLSCRFRCRPGTAIGGVLFAPRSAAAKHRGLMSLVTAVWTVPLIPGMGDWPPLIPLTASHVFQSITFIPCGVVPDKSNHAIIGRK